MRSPSCTPALACASQRVTAPQRRRGPGGQWPRPHRPGGGRSACDAAWLCRRGVLSASHEGTRGNLSGSCGACEGGLALVVWLCGDHGGEGDGRPTPFTYASCLGLDGSHRQGSDAPRGHWMAFGSTRVSRTRFPKRVRSPPFHLTGGHQGRMPPCLSPRSPTSMLCDWPSSRAISKALRLDTKRVVFTGCEWRRPGVPAALGLDLRARLAGNGVGGAWPWASPVFNEAVSSSSTRKRAGKNLLSLLCETTGGLLLVFPGTEEFQGRGTAVLAPK